MKKWLGCLAVCMALFVPGLSQAEDVQKDKEIVSTMEEVVVTAGRVEEKKKEITSNVTIIDEEEINNSSARDLGDLLAEKGIGHIQKYPGNLISIGIRGFRTETHGNDLKGHVLILLNGRRAATGNVAKLMTKNIERIEILRGPASVQYGSAAMGGIVNVITKQGKGKPTVFVEGILGSFDHEEWSAGFSGKLERFDFSGSFTRESMDDYDDADGNKYQNTGIDEISNCSLNVGFEFFPGNRIGIIYTDFDADKAGNPGYMSLNDLDDYTDKKNESIDFIYEGGTPNGPFSWMVRYFDGEDEDKWFDPVTSNPDFWDDGIPSESKTDQEGAQAQASFNSDIFLVTAGFDWVNYEVETTWDPKKTEYDNPSYFLLAKTRLFDQRFIVSGGLRYDEYDVEVKENQGNDESDSNLSPRVGVAYLITDYLKLRANYGEAFMMPSADQMAADYVIWGTHYLGNPNLDPEKSNTYEGGIDYSYGSFNSSLTYFYTDFEDKIESVSKPGGISTWENINDATIEGVEGEFSCDIGALFALDFEVKPYASFVYLTEYEDEETGEDLKYISDLHISYGITISDLNGLSANLNFAYTGEQKVEDWENYAWPGPVEVIKKGGFTVANFTISKKILDYKKYGGLTLRSEIQNLLDKEYEYVKGYPMPGRSFFIGMRYDY
jgi:vitamin B12 transporter